MQTISYPLANCGYKVKLTLDQLEAIENRDLLKATSLGVIPDIYMSCIDPDYPPIFQVIGR